MSTVSNNLSAADPAAHYAARMGRGAGSGTTASANGPPPSQDNGTANGTINGTETSAQSSVGKTVATTSKHLQSMAAEANQALGGITSLQIQVDQNLNTVVVKVVDTSTNQVIRQIPSEQMVDLLQRMKDLQGLLCDTKA